MIPSAGSIARGISKKIKNFFSPFVRGVTGKAEVPALFLSMKERDARSILWLEKTGIELFLADAWFWRRRGGGDPSFRFLTLRMSKLRQLPKFCNRFRLPKDSHGAHHRKSQQEEGEDKDGWAMQGSGSSIEAAFGVAVRRRERYTSFF